MSQGWIKLHRILLNKPIWQKSTPEQKTILITLLLMANHEENEWEWQGEKFKVRPGQMITSLESIRKECGKGITTQNIRSALVKFEKYGFLTNKSTKTGRLITIVNWETYQGGDEETNKAANKEVTKNQQRGNKEVTPNKNDKNDNNEKNDKKLIIEPFLLELMNELKKVNNYPFDFDKDTEFLKNLLVEFPTIDIREQIKKWAIYVIDNPFKKKSNPRLQLRNWCKNAARWHNEKTVQVIEPQSSEEKNEEDKIKNITTLPDDKTLKEWLARLPK